MRRPIEAGSEFVTVLLPPRLIEALDSRVRMQAAMNRSDALRDAFEEWCAERGLVETPGK